jgi:ADP-ribosylation factor related protein 1
MRRVTDSVLKSPRLLNLPLLLLANKQDEPSCLSLSEVRESFDAWQRAKPESTPPPRERLNSDGSVITSGTGVDWDDGGARAERAASLDVLGISALKGLVSNAMPWATVPSGLS